MVTNPAIGNNQGRPVLAGVPIGVWKWNTHNVAGLKGWHRHFCPLRCPTPRTLQTGRRLARYLPSA